MAPKRKAAAAVEAEVVDLAAEEEKAEAVPPAAGAKKPKAKATKGAGAGEKDKHVARGDTPRAPELGKGADAVKVVAWNVAGLRALLKNKGEALAALAEREAPYVLCLQEHKLQDKDVGWVEAELKVLLPSYDRAFWAVSTAKKGYSGVVALVRKGVAAELVEGEKGALGGPEHLAVVEGRVLTLDVAGALYVVLAYVPNSGMKLDRLPYRMETWEPDVRAHLAKLDAERPVVYMGDLNVAHLDADIYNYTAKHIPKSAGTTPQERAAFGELLESGNGYVDAFRHFHGDVAGVFSYWSGRAGNRPFNRGLRLDYSVVSSRLAAANVPAGQSRLHDAYILDDVEASDHAPIAVTVALS